MSYTKAIKMIDAAVADTTSEYFVVGDREAMSFQFIASGISTGNGILTVEISNDGTNWVQYNRLTTNVTNTNGQNDTRVASLTLSTNTSAFLFVPHGDHFEYVRVKLDMTTDGTYTVIMHNVIS
jgi:hypothetical protein